MIELKFKDRGVFASAFKVRWHPKLVDLLFSIEEEKLITCAYESRKYISLHSMEPLRAVDLRSYIYRDPKSLVDKINEEWIYNPNAPRRNVAIYHNVGRGRHIHLQVHDDTERKKEVK